MSVAIPRHIAPIQSGPEINPVPTAALFLSEGPGPDDRTLFVRYGPESRRHKEGIHSFPGGVCETYRLQDTTPAREYSHITAVRETYEETGVLVPSDSVEPLPTLHFATFDGRLYYMRVFTSTTWHGALQVKDPQKEIPLWIPNRDVEALHREEKLEVNVHPAFLEGIKHLRQRQ